MALLSNTGIRAGASGAGGASGYQIEKSLRFNPDDTPELTMTPSSGDSKQFTISFWTKFCKWDSTYMIIQTDDTYADLFRLYFSSGKFRVHQYNVSTYFWEYISTPVFRDPSAWYHVVFSYDARNLTEANRARTWINGVQITDWDTADHPNHFDDAGYNQTSTTQRIGREYTTTYGSYYKYDGYLAEFYSIDGQSLDASAFGEIDAKTGQWVAKEYTGTYGRQHNQAEVWSDDMSGTSNSGVYTNLFDGTMTGYEVGGDGNTLTYTPDGGISATTSIRINLWQSSGTYASAADITVNGSSVKSAIGTAMGTGSVGGWFDIGTTSLTTLTWSNPSGGNNDYRLYAIEVDGKMLTDTGVTPPADNSFYLKFNGTDLGEDSSGNDNDFTATNLTQTVTGTSVESGSYVENLTYTNTASDYSPMDYLSGFDTNTSTWWNISTGGGTTTATWTPSSAVDTSDGGFRCYHYGSWHISGTGYEIQFNINGTGWYTVGSLSNPNGHADAVPQWWTVTVPGNSLTSFATKTISGNAGWGTSGWSALEVNGEVLKESGDENTVDVSTDTPTDFDDGGNGTGNYCTMNPLHHLADLTLSQGNLKTSTSGYNAFSTFLLTSGKWYVEHTVGANHGYNLCFSQPDHPSGSTPSSAGSKSIGYYSNGTFYWGSGSNNAALAASYTTGDVIAAAIDMDGSTIKCYKNNNLETTIDFSTGTYHRFAEGMLISQFSGYGTWNFGARAYKYTPPTGYKALNTYNLPDPVITDPSKYFETKEYTGTGATHAITGLNFSPDLVWLKKYTSASHAVFDTVRGVQERLKIDSTDAEGTDATTLTAFGTEGFTLSTHDDVNQNTDGYVSWNWDSGSANTSVSAGDLNSTVYNNSDMWSDDFDGNVDSSYPAERAFDIGTSNTVYATANTTATWTPDGTITGVNTLEVRAYAYQAGGTYSKLKVNGTDHTSLFGSDYTVWKTVPMSGTTLTTLSIGGEDGTHYVGLVGIRINGKELVDSNVTLVNVPSIASTYRANPEAGFSIVEWTGTTSNETVAHGLNAKSDFMICKKTSTGGNSWIVWHKDIGDDKYLVLNASSAIDTDATLFNSHTNNSSTVFSLGTNNSISDASQTAIAYLWSGAEGYSKFGTFTGNGSADGPFIYCGFRPKYILTKGADGNDWYIRDTVRSPFNVVDNPLRQDTGGTYSGREADILSNGFKLRTSDSQVNSNNTVYYYAAFAESPFKYVNAR